MTFSLQNKVISSQLQGEFYDLETHPYKKFKENKSWTLEKGNILNNKILQMAWKLLLGNIQSICKA
jgi:hypothetical protein